MHYALITYGTRGDVMPYIALALGLIEKGHRVTLLAPQNFNDLVESYGITFHALYGDSEKLLYTPEALRVLRSGNTFSLMRYMQKGSREIQARVSRDVLKGSEQADILISNVLSIIWVQAVAEKLNKKWGIVQLNPPSVPTKAFPFAGLAFFDSPYYNLFSHHLVRYFFWQFNKKDLNTFRQSLGLPVCKINPLNKVVNDNILNIHGFSPQLIPQPLDWNNNSLVTGFLFVPKKIRESRGIDKPPDKLLHWLNAGEKPVYVGFGSMPIPDPELLGDILNKIVAVTGLRVIFCRGWSVVSNLKAHPNLFEVDYIYHEWLFPQCNCAIVHGGAGTVAAVLKAKLPLIIVSIFGDQPWWGDIIRKKHLGTHIPFKQLTTQNLLKAIEYVQTPGVAKNINAIGGEIEKEDGLNAAVTVIDQYFN
nr:glycosyltransferase [Mucilaginibacter sp. L294]